MSMSMSLDNNAVSAKTAPPSEMPTDIPATSTPAPTAALTEETNSSLLQEGCNDEPQAAIAIPLEVDTAADKSSFEAELVDAIATGLSDDYIICGSRRLEDGNFGISNLRVGNITVVKHPTGTFNGRRGGMIPIELYFYSPCPALLQILVFPRQLQRMRATSHTPNW